MLKKIVIGSVFLLMFSWALYELLASNENESSSEGAIESFSTGDDLTPGDDASDTNEEDEEVSSTEIAVGLAVGNTAPDFQLVTLDGEEVRLSDFLGKRVMINFWATWCPPCRVEMPDMEKFHSNNDVVILAVNLTETESSIEQIQDFVSEYALTFPVLLDETLTVATAYEIHPLPTSLLVDSSGVIHNIAYGALNYEQMVSELEKMQ